MKDAPFFHDCAVNNGPFGKTSGQEKAQMKMKKLFFAAKIGKKFVCTKKFYKIITILWKIFYMKVIYSGCTEKGKEPSGD